MEALYGEYKKVKIDIHRKSKIDTKKEVSETEDNNDMSSSHKKYAPSLSDTIAGYIYRYQFLDLFSSNFLYTVGDLTNGTDTALLSRTLLSTLESDDIEMLRIIDLHLESDHIDANPELIERAFRDLLR
jgi:hypothetical protein